jgi:hypothetical protein
MRALAVLSLVLAVVAPAGAEFVAQEADFGCLTDGVKVPGRNFRIFHHDPATLTAAVEMVMSGDVSAGLPEGTILQLIANEAMVKRGGTFNPDADGWEFFRLRTTLTGETRIVVRGGAEVLNAAGNSCQGCHTTRAAAQDFVIGMTRTSGPLASAFFDWLQGLDARCKP